MPELVFGGGWVGGILIDADEPTRVEALGAARLGPLPGEVVARIRALQDSDFESGDAA